MTGTPESDFEQTIAKAKEVTAEIKQAADLLAVANTVLETHLTDAVQVEDVAQALDHAEAVEKTLTKSADSLDKVNAALDDVVAKSPGA